MEELGDGAADHNLTEGEGGEYLVEGVLREAVDRRRLHFRFRGIGCRGSDSAHFSSALLQRGERKREI